MKRRKSHFQFSLMQTNYTKLQLQFFCKKKQLKKTFHIFNLNKRKVNKTTKQQYLKTKINKLT